MVLMTTILISPCHKKVLRGMFKVLPHNGTSNKGVSCKKTSSQKIPRRIIPQLGPRVVMERKMTDLKVVSRQILILVFSSKIRTFKQNFPYLALQIHPSQMKLRDYVGLLKTRCRVELGKNKMNIEINPHKEYYLLILTVSQNHCFIEFLWLLKISSTSLKLRLPIIIKRQFRVFTRSDGCK